MFNGYSLKLNTSFNKPLGVEVEGGSDTESPYIQISAIKPGSLAERSRMNELEQSSFWIAIGIEQSVMDSHSQNMF